MVDKALTDITNEVADPTETAPGDLLCITDSSDTTASTGGTSHKVQLKNTGFPVLLERITHATGSEFDFSSIPTGYKRLIIKGELLSSKSATSDGVQIFFNTDTTSSNYVGQQIAGLNSTSYYGNDASRIGEAAAATSASDTSHIEIVIEDYAGSNIKGAMSRYAVVRATTEMYIGLVYVGHKTLTAAIDRVRIRPTGYATDTFTGELTLYGEA